MKVTYKLYPARLKVPLMELAERVVGRMGDAIIQTAQHYVTPGVGPGPHPHKHIDTGWLMVNIVWLEQMRWRGAVLNSAIGNTNAAPYGLFLEVGWHSKAGNFFRYPWLWPSALRIWNYADAFLSEERLD